MDMDLDFHTHFGIYYVQVKILHFCALCFVP